MRYELSDYEWIAIKPMIPNRPHGVWRCLLSLALGRSPARPCRRTTALPQATTVRIEAKAADQTNLIGQAFVSAGRYGSSNRGETHPREVIRKRPLLISTQRRLLRGRCRSAIFCNERARTSRRNLSASRENSLADCERVVCGIGGSRWSRPRRNLQVDQSAVEALGMPLFQQTNGTG
jgi:hypothetical protein